MYSFPLMDHFQMVLNVSSLFYNSNKAIFQMQLLFICILCVFFLCLSIWVFDFASMMDLKHQPPSLFQSYCIFIVKVWDFQSRTGRAIGQLMTKQISKHVTLFNYLFLEDYCQVSSTDSTLVSIPVRGFEYSARVEATSWHLKVRGQIWFEFICLHTNSYSIVHGGIWLMQHNSYACQWS